MEFLGTGKEKILHSFPSTFTFTCFYLSLCVNFLLSMTIKNGKVLSEVIIPGAPAS